LTWSWHWLWPWSWLWPWPRPIPQSWPLPWPRPWSWSWYLPWHKPWPWPWLWPWPRPLPQPFDLGCRQPEVGPQRLVCSLLRRRVSIEPFQNTTKQTSYVSFIMFHSLTTIANVYRIQNIFVAIWNILSVSVTSLRLASHGAVTDDVTLFYLKKWRPFWWSSYTVTTRTLYAFPASSFLAVNSAAKNYTFIRVSLPRWCPPVRSAPLPPPSPLASDAISLYSCRQLTDSLSVISDNSELGNHCQRLEVSAWQRSLTITALYKSTYLLTYLTLEHCTRATRIFRPHFCPTTL